MVRCVQQAQRISPLGIDPYNDGGKLFKEACSVWVASAFILFAYRAEATALVRRFIK